MVGRIHCTFVHIMLVVMFTAGLSHSQKTIHFFSPWVTDPTRTAYTNYIQGQSGGGFNSWWPGATMTNEGGGWYSYTFPAGSTQNDIQFRIMNSSDNNGGNGQYALPTGIAGSQGSSFSNIALFGTNNDVYLYYEGGLPVLTAIPPAGKYLMIFNPFSTMPYAEVQGKTGTRGTITVESPCGWYLLPILGDPNIAVRFVNAAGTSTYGAGGAGTTTFIDLTGKFDNTDTVWVNTPATGPEYLSSSNGLKGRCAVMRLASIIRDFKTDKSHTDFETVGWDNSLTCKSTIKGIVDVNLGADRKPVKVKDGCQMTNFDQWFGRTGTDANYFTGCMDLKLDLNAKGAYEYKNDEFFPIDNLNKGFNGINVDLSPDGNKHAHNFGFCMETHAKFTYKGGEVFTFKGDDDVWVYINNKLVVDLGNVHEALSDSVALDTLKLTKGQSYPFDFFFCERQSTGSHMWITTDIDLLEARDVVLDKSVETVNGTTRATYAVFIHTQGGVGCIAQSQTDKLSANFEITKRGSGVRSSLGSGVHYGGGIKISSTRDTVVVDTTHMFGLDSGSTYILYVIDPNAVGVYDSIVFQIPKAGTVPPPPNLAPSVTADTLSIAEDQGKGAVVGSVTASDPEGAPLTYAIIGSGPFAIDSKGKITLTGPIDFEKIEEYVFKVVVSDGALTDTASILIKVTNVAEPIEIRIVSVLVGDSLWGNGPDTVRTNVLKADLNGAITGSMIHGTKDTTAHVGLKEGVNHVGIKVCTSDKLACATDSVVILVSTKKPTVVFEHPKPDTSGIRNLVYTYTASDTFFVNNPWAKIPGTLVFKDKDLKLDTLEFTLSLMDYKLKEGVNHVKYSYTDSFGNSVTADLIVVLDTKAPVVVILNPMDKQIFKQFNIDVDWTVDDLRMDTLTRASLAVGNNRIIRSAMDRAGNVGSDTVFVVMKQTKADVSIDLVQPVIVLKPDEMDDAFSVNPPRKDERFTLSVVNQKTDQEDEVGYGKSDGSIVRPEKIGEGRTYSTQGKNAHVGPTLRIEVRLQSIGGYNESGNLRSGTLGELMEWAKANDIPQKEAMCGENIPESKWNSIPLWKNQIKVEAQIFDNMGQFIDTYKVSADSIGPDYLDDGGMATFNMSLSPDKGSKNLKDSRGRTLGTGAYLIRGVVNAVSTYLWCAGEYEQGEKIKSTENILKGFGYRRFDQKAK